MTASVYTVLIVVRIGTGLKMIGSYTRRVVALVAGKRFSPIAVMQIERNTMSKFGFTPKVDSSVVGVISATSPYPTGFGFLDVGD